MVDKGDLSKPRIMIAGTHSGCGKTTVTCALLKAFSIRELSVSAFKCGPDYIDPMFHREIIGTPSSNLDIFLSSENAVKYSLHAADTDLSVIEGVMGFFDGLGGDTDFASSKHLSELTDTPVIFVADAKGASLSVAAMISGFCGFKPNRISGVILNRCSDGIFPKLKTVIEKYTGIPVLGYLPVLPKAKIESRHLGLLTAQEIGNLTEKITILGEAALKYIDIPAVIKLAETAPPLEFSDIKPEPACKDKTIAVAQDKAFCFYYEDNFRILEKLGAKLEFFSPLGDKKLPENTDGLILGGGYPELYAKELSDNRLMLDSIRDAVKNGLPVIAECGGFMYLHEYMCGYAMAGVIPGSAAMTEKLRRFGYITLTAKEDNLLCKKGGSINAHEFHYSESTNPGGSFLAEKTGHEPYACIHAGKTMFAGYPHINFLGNPDFARNFCLQL